MMKTGKPRPNKLAAAKSAPQPTRKQTPNSAPARNTPRRPSK